MSHKVLKAVIPAAGVGTRLLPASKSVPKELLPIVDRPLIHYIADECVRSGIRDLIFVCAPERMAVVSYFARDRKIDGFLKKNKKSYLLNPLYRLGEKLNVRAVEQKEPAGLGHAVGCAQRAVGRDPFFSVILPDDILEASSTCLKQMLGWQKTLGASVVALAEVPAADVSRYGIAAVRASGEEDLFEITGLVEKPSRKDAPSRYAVVGRYILSRAIFGCLRNLSKGALGEIQLTDALHALLQKEKIYGFVFRGKRYDVGNPVGLFHANFAFARHRPEFSSLLHPDPASEK